MEYAYNTEGYLRSVRDRRGYTRSYDYDAAGRLESEVDQNGHRVFFNVYDNATGRITSQTDADNKVTTFAWDPNTQTSTMTDPRNGRGRTSTSATSCSRRPISLARPPRSATTAISTRYPSATRAAPRPVRSTTPGGT